LIVEKLAQSLFAERRVVLLLKIVSAKQTPSTAACQALDQVMDGDFDREGLREANGIRCAPFR